MKERIISITIVAVLLISLPVLFASSKKSEVKSATWRVINIYNDYIELKKGTTEIAVYFAENTKFIAKDGTEAKKDILMICQYVDADYKTEGTKKILNKIIIKKDSDCVK